MRQAKWHITDTLVQDVKVLRETDTEAQIETGSHRVVWVSKSGLTDER